MDQPDGSGSQVYLSKISLTDFRNYRSLSLALQPGAIVLTGENGAGKTNLLEAIYFLATTKSFRTPRIASVFRHGEPNVFVSGEVERDGLVRTLSVGLESAESRRRVFALHFR